MLTSVETPLPAGFSTPEHLTADPNGSGVWFIAESSDQLRLFDVKAPGKTPTSFLLGVPQRDDLVTFVQNAIAVADDGSVWVGVNDHLFRVDPATASITKIDLPAVTTFGSLPIPPKVANIRAITSIATRGQTVAVGSSFSDEIALVNGKSLQLMPVVSVPAGTVTSLAYASDGTLFATDEGVPNAGDASFSGLDLLAAAPGATTADVAKWYPYAALFVHSRGTNVALFSPAQTSIQTVDLDTSKSGQVVLPDSSPVNLPKAGSSYAPDLDAAISASMIAASTADGVVVSDTASSVVGVVTLPRVSCGVHTEGPTGLPGDTTGVTAAPQANDCPQTSIAQAIDAVGSIWMLPSADDSLLAATP